MGLQTSTLCSKKWLTQFVLLDVHLDTYVHTYIRIVHHKCGYLCTYVGNTFGQFSTYSHTYIHMYTNIFSLHSLKQLLELSLDIHTHVLYMYNIYLYRSGWLV